jgi:hypothetical protein
VPDDANALGPRDGPRGFNRRAPQYRAELIATLAAMQAAEGWRGSGYWRPMRVAPGIVAHCSSVLAPYVEAGRRSRRNWELLRTREDEERDRRPYVAGMGQADLVWRLGGKRRWMAA